jgi:serine/threonine protein kinase
MSGDPPDDPTWTDVESVFDAALARARGERAAFLDSIGRANPRLRGEVESLLAAHDTAGDFLDQPIVAPRADDADDVDLAAANGLVGTRIGPFTLAEPIGRGGMGIVYRAERQDGDFTQRVAIKIIDLSLQQPGTLHRFKAERQILATLWHPHIVSLLDGGVTAAGQAYLVMEFVEGVPITTYCATKQLPLADRLQLVDTVCGAVQYAHQHGVVHCDLKPGNILVTPDGVPKVLDFGIAKLLRTPDRPDARDTTGGVRPLTPNYASPEQLRGLPMTTASDIYALGALLYELLAGAPPYQLSHASLEEMLHCVVEVDPRRPSAVHAPESLVPYSRKLLRGDLDAIVLKALRKAPSDRYASARELADDLERSRNGQPVVAREPSFGYLLARVSRRHRAAVAAAVISVVALVSALGVSLWETRLARADNRRATARFNDTRQLANDLLFKLEASADMQPSTMPLRRQIVAEALTYLERLSQDPAGDDSLRFDLARGYHRVADIQGKPSAPNLGDRDGAIKNYHHAIDLLGPLTSGPKASREALIELARTEISLAGTVSVQDRRDEARQAALAASAIGRALLARNPKDPEARRALASAEFSLATIERPTGNDLPHWQAAGDMFESLLADDPGDADRRRNVALVQKYIGSHYEYQGDFSSALPHFLRARALDDAQLRARPADRVAQFDVAIDLASVANAQLHTGHLQDAAATYEQSLAMRQALAAFDPNDVLARSRVAFVHTRLSVVYGQMGQYKIAVAHAHEAVRLAESMVGLDVVHRVTFAQDLTDLGFAQARAGDAHAACVAFGRSAEVIGPVKREPSSSADTRSTVEDLESDNARGMQDCRAKGGAAK